MALVCVILFPMAGLAAALVRPNFELLLCPAYLILLGSMMACWGGSETRLRRRLELLKDVGKLSNPRFGVDRTISLDVTK